MDISLGYCADVMLALLNKGVINSVTSSELRRFYFFYMAGSCRGYRLFDKRFGPVF